MTKAHDKLVSSWRGKNNKIKNQTKLGGTHIPTNWTLDFMMCKRFPRYGENFFPRFTLDSWSSLRRDSCTERNTICVFSFWVWFWSWEESCGFQGKVRKWRRWREACATLRKIQYLMSLSQYDICNFYIFKNYYLNLSKYMQCLFFILTSF